MLFAAVLSVSTGVVGCWWPISDKAVLMEVYFWQFSNKPTSSASVADAITLLMMPHSTFTGPFSGGIFWICVLDFGSKKKYPLDLICASGSDMYDASEYTWRIIQLFCILLCCLDVLRCNLENECFFAVSVVGFFYIIAREFWAIKIVGSIAPA